MSTSTNTLNESSVESPAKKAKGQDVKAIQLPIPVVGRCHLYLPNKRRHCKLESISGSKYCGEHFAHDVEGNANLKRIPCPYDPAHTCFEKDLKSHLKKCNMKPKKAEIYERKGINADSINHNNNNNNSDNIKQLSDNFVPFADLTTEELKNLIETVQSIHKEFVPSIPEKFGIHPIVAKEMVKSDIGPKAMKHLVQNASLLSLLEQYNLLQKSTSFLEFGSGTGALSFWVASASNDPTSHFVLLDRKSHRNKRDNKLKDTGLEIKRIRIDINDLQLDALPSVNATEHVVGITKHLCGIATDLALRCLLETNSKVSKVSGLVLATCCHHCCTYESYAGTSHIKDWGITKEYFKYFTSLVSWATCGTRPETKDDCDDGETKDEQEKHVVIAYPKYAALGLDSETRRQIGLQAKEILDYGRCMYIKSFGLTPILCHYTDTSTTLENVAIIATRC